MSSTSVTTVLYADASRIAERYAAWVLIHDNRRISKQDAVNEIITKAAAAILPEEFTASADPVKMSKKKM